MKPTHIFRYIPIKIGTLNMTQRACRVILSDFVFRNHIEGLNHLYEPMSIQ